jgi:hypothetical protein
LVEEGERTSKRIHPSGSVIADDNETDLNGSITGLNVEKSAQTVGKGWTGGMIAGVVVGVLVVIVILVCIAWWCMADKDPYAIEIRRLDCQL